MNQRLNETLSVLGKLFGGFTSIKGEGGYYSSDRDEIIKEPVVVVESFSTIQNFKDKVEQWIDWLIEKHRDWDQEAIGVQIEDELFYV